MGMIEYSRYYIRTIMNLVLITVPKWMIYIYYTNPSHEIPLSFMWLKFSSFGWDIDEENKEWQEHKIGDAQGTPKAISKKDSSV